MFDPSGDKKQIFIKKNKKNSGSSSSKSLSQSQRYELINLILIVG